MKRGKIVRNVNLKCFEVKFIEIKISCSHISTTQREQSKIIYPNVFWAPSKAVGGTTRWAYVVWSFSLCCQWFWLLIEQFFPEYSRVMQEQDPLFLLRWRQFVGRPRTNEITFTVLTWHCYLFLKTYKPHIIQICVYIFSI